MELFQQLTIKIPLSYPISLQDSLMATLENLRRWTTHKYSEHVKPTGSIIVEAIVKADAECVALSCVRRTAAEWGGEAKIYRRSFRDERQSHQWCVVVRFSGLPEHSYYFVPCIHAPRLPFRPLPHFWFRASEAVSLFPDCFFPWLLVCLFPDSPKVPCVIFFC